MPRSPKELAKAFDALQERCRVSTTSDAQALLEHARALGDEVRESIAAHVAPAPVEIARASTKDLYCGSAIAEGGVVLWDRGRFRYMPGIVLAAGQFRATIHVVDDVCDDLHRLDFGNHAKRMSALADAFEKLLRSPSVLEHGGVVTRIRDMIEESRVLARTALSYTFMLDPGDVIPDRRGTGVLLGPRVWPDGEILALARTLQPVYAQA